MYVDDTLNNDLINYLNDKFEKVLIYKNGSEALKSYKEEFNNNIKIPLLISAINIEGINGLELYENIKLINQDSKCIFTSAREDKEALLKVIELNIDGYFLKPYSIDDIKLKIEELMYQEHFKVQLELQRHYRKQYINALNKIAVVYKMNREGKIIDCNDIFKSITGFKDNNIKLRDFLHHEISNTQEQEVWEGLDKNGIWTGNTKYLNISKEVFYLKVSIFREGDEYITIGFENTTEYNKKRKIHKTIIQKISSCNMLNAEKDKEIKIISEENKILKIKLKSLIDEKKSLFEKNRNNLKQLEHYEKQMFNINNNKENSILNKKDNLSNMTETILKKEKEIKLYKEKSKHFEEEYNARLEEINKVTDIKIEQSKEIRDLRDLVNTLEETINDIKKENNIN